MSPSFSDPSQAGRPDAGLSGHERRNRAAWNADADDYQARHGRQLAGDGKAWSTWGLPESELGVLGAVAGRDVLELGCGAAQGSIQLAKAGARPIGLDLSEGQLGNARRLILETGMAVPLVQASAEAVPLADASFDIVFCDHGAMNFADPYRTVPEVARLLRPGGMHLAAAPRVAPGRGQPQWVSRAQQRPDHDPPAHGSRDPR